MNTVIFGIQLTPMLLLSLSGVVFGLALGAHEIWRQLREKK